MSSATTTPTFGGSLLQRVTAVQDALRHQGVQPIDMRRAGTLETELAIPLALDPADQEFPDLILLEGPIDARVIPRENHSQFTWFIDGAQKTMPVWLVGVVPIIVGIVVVGVLERQNDGSCVLIGDSLAERLTWFVPEQTNDPQLRAVIDVLSDLGETVIDPLAEQPNYDLIANSYAQMLYFASEQANAVRARTEERTVRLWDERIRRTREDRWLVVDGRLPGQYLNAIGFVKDPARQHFAGADATRLYTLPAGHRTSAYQIGRDRPTDGDAGGDGSGRLRTMWYQRMWPSTGLDPRHALIRIETAPAVQDSDEIDGIASWLMAERVPRPTADSRWPTLLYPTHILERLLKRRIAQLTSGWPV